jgi:hypothetical protein
MQGTIDIVLTSVIMLCAVIIVIEAARRWYAVLVHKRYSVGGVPVATENPALTPPEYGCC